MRRWPSLLLLAVAAGACVSSLASQLPGGAELEARCRSGGGVACRELGFLVLRHDVDAGAEAATFFRRGCDTDWESCLALAYYIDTPIFTARQKAWALKVLVEGCERGKAEACSRAADALLNDTRGAQDVAAAMDGYSRACTLGDPRACYLMWRATSEGRYGVTTDADAGSKLLARSVELYELRCAQGVLRDCDYLEELFRRGNPLPFDLPALLRVRATACDAGREEACTRGPEVPWREELDSDQLSCALGNPEGCWATAWRLRRKQGAPEQVALAERLDTWACARGSKDSCVALGDALLGDAGGPRDEVRGVALLERACELGAAKACYLLGVAKDEAQFGLTGDRDAGARLFERSLRLYEESCSDGEDSSCVFLEQLYASARTTMNLERVLSLRETWCKAGHAQSCRRGPKFEPPATLKSGHVVGCAIGNARSCASYAFALRTSGATGLDQELDSWACEHDDVFGCMALADRALTDGGLASSPPAAFAAYRRACETGHGAYCAVLAAALRETQQEGAPALDARAASLFWQSCEGGDTEACGVCMGYALDGVRLPRDLKRAFELHTLRCERRDELACDFVGWYWRFGLHGTKDVAKAIPLLEKACRTRTDLLACEEVASLSGGGEQVPKNPERAAELRGVARAAWSAEVAAGVDAGLHWSINGDRICKDLELDASCQERSRPFDRYLLVRSDEARSCFQMKTGSIASTGRARVRVELRPDGGAVWSALPIERESEVLTRCVLDAVRAWDLDPALLKGLSGSVYVFESR